MSDDDEGEEYEGFLSSKFWRTTLMVVAGVLIFAGPTYLPLALNDFLNVDYVVSLVVGFVLLIAGLVLLWFLVRKKVVT